MKVIQVVVSLEVSKLNHTVMNKKQGDQMQFSLEKKTKKKKMNSSNPPYQAMDCVIKWGNRLEMFSFVSKCLSYNREKTAEMR